MNLVAIITSFLSGGLITGIVVARLNWKIEIKRDRRISRKKLIEDIREHFNKIEFETLKEFRESSLYHRISPDFTFELIQQINENIEEVRRNQHLFTLANPSFISIDPKMTQEETESALELTNKEGYKAKKELGEIARKIKNTVDKIYEEVAKIEKKWKLV